MPLAVTSVALVVLVGLGLLTLFVLLFPPVSLGDRLFGPPFLTLEPAAPRLEQDELTIALRPDVPGAPPTLEVRARAVSAAQFLGQPGPDDPLLQAARADWPANLTPVSAIYRIEARGAESAPPGAVSLAILLPEAPRDCGISMCDMYVYDAAARRWAFQPASAQAHERGWLLATNRLPGVVVAARLRRQVPVISIVVEPGQAFKPQVAALANVVHPAGLRPNAAGALDGALPAGIEPGQGYAIAPLIRADGSVAALLQDEAARREHIQRLIEFATSKSYDGLAIEYRDLPSAARDAFSAFIAALARELRANNATLTVVLPFPTQDGSLFQTGAYDWQALGAAADVAQIQLPLDPAAFAEQGAVRRMLSWAVGQISRAKIQVALHTRCPQKSGASWRTVGYAEALAALGKPRLVPPDSVKAGQPLEANLTGLADGQAQLDLVDGLPRLDSNGAQTYLITRTALRAQLGVIVPYNLAGAQIVDLTAPGAYLGLVEVLADFKVHRGLWAVAPPAPLMLRWRVLNADDQVINEQTSVAGVPFSFTPDGAFPALRIEAQSLDFGLTLGSAAVRVSTRSQ